MIEVDYTCPYCGRNCIEIISDIDDIRMVKCTYCLRKFSLENLYCPKCMSNMIIKCGIKFCSNVDCLVKHVEIINCYTLCISSNNSQGVACSCKIIKFDSEFDYPAYINFGFNCLLYGHTPSYKNKNDLSEYTEFLNNIIIQEFVKKVQDKPRLSSIFSYKDCESLACCI